MKKKYILVCDSFKPKNKGVGCCGEKEPGLLINGLKEEVQRQGAEDIIEIIPSACLNQCAYGVTLKYIPGNTLYGSVQISDIADIIAATKEGREIERLTLQSPPRFWE